jgi:DNA polymerase/3'-5' exonuclease PolX
MNSFKIIHAFRLHSVDKFMSPHMIYAPVSEQEVTELRKYAEGGACEEMLPKAKEEKKTVPTVDPTDDITVVPGMGKKIQADLAALGVTTKSGLKDKLEDAKVKEALGANFDKIAAYFTASPTA